MSVIEASSLSYGYSHGTPFEITALNNVSFTVQKGELVGIIGHTGSGKSTLMQMLNGLIKPELGVVYLNGNDINKDKLSVRDAHFKVGLCFQYPEYQLFEETCAKDIAFGPKNMGLSEDEIKNRIISSADIVGLDRRLLNKSPFDLSGGQKRRCAIAGVIAMFPEILILDEPAAGLDPSGISSIYSMIRNYREKTEATVFVVSHNMDEIAEIADKILVLNKGHAVYFGTPSEVFSHSSDLLDMGLNIPLATRIMLRISKIYPEANTSIYSLRDAYAEIERILSKEGK